MKRLASFLMIALLMFAFTWSRASIPDTKENSKTEQSSDKMVSVKKEFKTPQKSQFSMEKSDQPTSQFQVFCDTYDMKAEAKIHKASGKQKLLFSITSEDGKTEQSISLYKEDAEMLASFIQNSTYYLENRKIPDKNY